MNKMNSYKLLFPTEHEPSESPAPSLLIQEEVAGDNSSSQSNSTTDLGVIISPPSEWTNTQMVLIVCLGLLTLVTIVANSLVLFLFAKAKRAFQTPTNLLLANLAVADLLVGLVVMPLLSTTTILDGYKWIYGDAICWAFDYIHFLLCAASMWSMIAVGVDRYIGVSHPLQYKNIMTRRRTLLVIVGVWVLAFILTSGPLTGWPKQMSGIHTLCYINLEQQFMLFISFIAYWIPINSTILVYVLVYRRAVAPLLQRSSERLLVAKAKQTRLAKNIAIVTGTLFIFYAPVFVIFSIRAFDLPYFSLELLFLAAWVRYSCSTVNPFLYALAVPGYRKVIKDWLFGSRGDSKWEQTSTRSFDTQTEASADVLEQDGRHCPNCGVLLPQDILPPKSHVDDPTQVVSLKVTAPTDGPPMSPTFVVGGGGALTGQNNVEVMRRLRESVILPYLEHRRTQLKADQKESISLEEMDRIVAELKALMDDAVN